jgi:hypothetical protein
LKRPAIWHVYRQKGSGYGDGGAILPLALVRADYPEAGLRLLYRGDEALEIDGIRCLPCDAFLRRLVPGQPLP